MAENDRKKYSRFFCQLLTTIIDFPHSELTNKVNSLSFSVFLHPIELPSPYFYMHHLF